MTSPYVMEFNYSRRAWFSETTRDVPRVDGVEAHRHPDTQMYDPRIYHRKTFNTYNLGIVILEIAHWR